MRTKNAAASSGLVLGRMLKQRWISRKQLQVQAQPAETSGFERLCEESPYFLDYLAQQLRLFILRRS
jgi:hypothetical protein